MYALAVGLFMLVLPLASIAVEISIGSAGAGAVVVIARWFVFWGVGARLFVAGLRQIVQPRFTAETILGLKGEDVLVVVRELGFANVALGSLGLASVIAHGWVMAAALVGTIFYGLAGLNHARQAVLNRHERIAMVSDLLFAALLATLCVLH
jgi:hypothetical protein